MKLNPLNRVCIIVLDSVGVGALPDAHMYNDVGVNTLSNLSQKIGGISLPNLEQLGIGHITPILGVNNQNHPMGAYGKMAEKSAGKDTTTGHWEMMGIISKEPFGSFPDGFPKELMDAFSKKSGHEAIGNVAASGTEIIEQLGDEHVKTKKLIVYTSADSVFQIAAHEDVIPLHELYRVCEIARELCDPYKIARVIARPFTGESPKFYRTKDRKDFSIALPGKTVLNRCDEAGLVVAGIGKIEDIFAHSGVTRSRHSKTNEEGIVAICDELKRSDSNIIFANLVDFDMLYGHRRDCVGYANALTYFDGKLPDIMACLKDTDLLIITADHGCDPTHHGSDHTREYVPVVMYHNGISPRSLGIRKTFADIGATLLDVFNIGGDHHEGTSLRI